MNVLLCGMHFKPLLHFPYLKGWTGVFFCFFLLLYGRNIFFFIYRKRESVSQTELEKKTSCVFFLGCVFFVFLILCALCFQSPVGNSLVLKSPSSFSPQGSPKMDLQTPSRRSSRYKKIKSVTAKYCSQLLYVGWWCYTGGGRGESSTPKQCKAIRVLTKALKRVEIKHLIKYSDRNSGWSCVFRLTNGCVWAEGGRRHPCQVGCYGSVRSAVSGISWWSPFTLRVAAEVFRDTSQPGAVRKVH